MAYGTNAPLGFQAKYSLTGATWNAQTHQYSIASGYSTSLYSGDPVIRLSSGTVGIWPGQNASAVPLLGVLQSIFYLDINGNPQPLPYWPANTVTLAGQDVYAEVFDDPNILYSIQTSTSANNPTAFGVAQNNLGCNIDAAVTVGTGTFAAITGPGGVYTPPNNPGTGSATNGGLSGYYADLSTMTNNATGVGSTLKIYSLDPIVNQSGGQVFYSDVAGVQNGVFNNILVLINNHIYKGGTGTVGTGTPKTSGP